MILALDPGETKIGWALVTEDGTPVGQGVLRAAGWGEALLSLPKLADVRVVVLGDGTARLNIEAELARLLPMAELAVVGERESTVEGWQLKRTELSRGNPLRALWLTLAQLFHSAPVDDYAARVLALRYLRARSDRGIDKPPGAS